MDAWGPTLLAVCIISLVSMVGALTLTLPGLRSHRVLLLLVAVAAGTLMGSTFFHLLPEAIEAWHDKGLDTMGTLVLGGFVAFFILEVALRSRHAHVELAAEELAHDHGHRDHDHGHGAHASHAAGHAHAAPAAHGHAVPAIAPFAWTNLLGDALHNLIDGAVVAAAFLVDTGVGVATSLAVIVHEVPQELGDFAVLLRSGLGVRKALLFNLLTALCSVVGAVVVLSLPVDADTIKMLGAPIIAGAFIYIAAADLVPELHHHSKGREAVAILAGFLAGLAIIYGLVALEESGVLSLGEEAGHDH